MRESIITKVMQEQISNIMNLNDMLGTGMWNKIVIILIIVPVALTCLSE